MTVLFVRHNIIAMTTLVLHLSKVFQRTISCFQTSVGESVCKGKASFSNRQIFSGFFQFSFQAARFYYKSISAQLRAYPFSLPCTLQGKILGAAPQHLKTTYTLLPSFHCLMSFPLESGCKGTHFFRFCKHIAKLFSNFLSDFSVIGCFSSDYKIKKNSACYRDTKRLSEIPP